MIKLGIAGKIGCGKSTVANYLKQLGWHVVQADEIGHRLLYEQDIKEGLARYFGPRIFAADGEIDRRALLTAALGQEDGMDFINSLTWPRIAALLPGELGSGNTPVALEAAVLLQAGWDAFLDRVLLIEASYEIRLQRLVSRFKDDQAALHGLMELQEEYTQMAEGAHYVLGNEGNEQELIKKVREIPEVKTCLN